MAEKRGSHRWKFFRAGEVDQVVIAEGDDLAHLGDLDQKLWLALSCPTRGLEFDRRTLDFVDADKDGHIRPPEILAAVDWCKQVLRSLDDLFRPGDSLPLSAINQETPAGRELHAACRRMLEKLGRPEAKELSLADVAGAADKLAKSRFNGDGILPPESADDGPTRKAVVDIIACLGGKPDAGGQPGVDQTTVDKFFESAAAMIGWFDQAEKDPAIRPLGASTAAALEALNAVQSKVDDYFARCSLAAFDPRASAALSPAEATLQALAGKKLTAEADEIAELPLAAVAPNRPLPLADGVNPAWAGKVEALASTVVKPILSGSPTALSLADWTAIKQKLASYAAWLAACPASPLLPLGEARVRELNAGGIRKELTDLIVKDTAVEDQCAQITQVEKLLLFRRDLVRLVRNFVNFSEFYGQRRAIFQVGTLYVDARSCSLCLPVEDSTKHSSVAGLAKAFLLYCDCTKGSEKRSIVAAVTGGSTDNLMVGRNGVFYDGEGRDWDATVTKIIENPIGIPQAFFAPYKRFVRMIEEQVAKRASAADDEARKKVESTAAQAAHADKTKQDQPAGPKPEAKKVDVGTVAAIGVAVAGIATFLSSILATFFGLGMWMPLGLLALILAISGPSMLIAWLKLRQRNVGPILDANGWSVNALARINIPFGTALTKVATLPRGSQRQMRDPFAPKRPPYGLYLILLLAVGFAALWTLGYLDPYLPSKLKCESVLGQEPPAETAAPAK